jgi:ABC-type transport system involved in multi-copper enzyme maturation permease subunit
MCNCTSKCLKLLIFLGCIVLLGVGAVLIWAGYYISKLTFLDSLDIDYIQTAWIIIIVCGCVSIAISILGFFGAWKDKSLLLGIFIVFGFIISLILIAFGAALIYARTFSEDYLGTEKKCLDHFEDADEGCDLAGIAMCHLYCPCKADNKYIDELRIKYLNDSVENQIYAYKDIGAENIKECNPCIEADRYTQNYSDAIDYDQYQDLVDWVDNNIGVDISSDCSVTAEEYKDKYFDSSVRKYFPMLKWVENTFDCSGLCTPQEVYLFSDADNGEPSGSCREELNDWIQEKFLQFGIISIIFGIYLLAVVMFACCICCCCKNCKGDSNVKEKDSINEENDDNKKKVKDNNSHDEYEIVPKTDKD